MRKSNSSTEIGKYKSNPSNFPRSRINQLEERKKKKTNEESIDNNYFPNISKLSVNVDFEKHV